MNDFEKAIAIVQNLYSPDHLELTAKRLDVTMAFVRLFAGKEGFRRNEFFDRCMGREHQTDYARRA